MAGDRLANKLLANLIDRKKLESKIADGINEVLRETFDELATLVERKVKELQGQADYRGFLADAQKNHEAQAGGG